MPYIFTLDICILSGKNKRRGNSPFCAYCPIQRRDHGRHAPNLRKVNPFRKIFTKNSHFQFLPHFPESQMRPDRINETALYGLHSACKCRTARGRPRKAEFPIGTRICEFFLLKVKPLYGPSFSRKLPPPIGKSHMAASSI